MGTKSEKPCIPLPKAWKAKKAKRKIVSGPEVMRRWEANAVVSPMFEERFRNSVTSQDICLVQEGYHPFCQKAPVATTGGCFSLQGLKYPLWFLGHPGLGPLLTTEAVSKYRPETKQE